MTSSERVRVEILVQEDGSLSVEKGSEPCGVESIRTGHGVILLQAEAKFPGRWLDDHAAADRSIETLDDIHRGLVTGGVGPVVPSRSGTEERCPLDAERCPMLIDQASGLVPQSSAGASERTLTEPLGTYKGGSSLREAARALASSLSRQASVANG